MDAKVYLQDCLANCNGHQHGGKRSSIDYCKLSDEIYEMMDELLENGNVLSNGRTYENEPTCSFWTDSGTECEKPRKKYRQDGRSRKRQKKKGKTRTSDDSREVEDTVEREDTEAQAERTLCEDNRNAEDRRGRNDTGMNAQNSTSESNEEGVQKGLEAGEERVDDEERGDNQNGVDTEGLDGQKMNLNSEENERNRETEKDEDREDQTGQKTQEGRQKNERSEVSGGNGESQYDEEPMHPHEQAVNPENNRHQMDGPDRLENAGTDAGSHDWDVQDEIMMESGAVCTSAEEQPHDWSNKGPERKLETDQRGATANFKALPYQYRPPRDFKSLSQLAPNHRLENVIGVVTHFTPVSRSKGSDFVMKMYIMDPTYYGSTREVLFFRPSKWQFPEIYCVGDIVRFHRIKAGQYLGDLQLISNRATSSMVFPGLSEEPITLDTVRYQTDNPSLTVETVRAVQQLRTWLWLNRDVICPAVLVSLSEISINSYCDVVGRVVSAAHCLKPDHPMMLTIYDATTPRVDTSAATESDETLHQLEGDENSECDQVLWSITRDLPKEKLVQVYLGDKHAKAVNELQLAAGQVVLLHSAWAELDSYGHLSLFLSNDGPELNGVSFINPSSKLGKKHALESD